MAKRKVEAVRAKRRSPAGMTDKEAKAGVVDLAAGAAAPAAWWTERDELEARRAYQEADAWARSVPGTPYGSCADGEI